MNTKLKQEMTDKIEAALGHLKGDLAGLHAGRASLALFESLHVNVYDTVMPLKQLATLAIPESRLVTIQPWDTTQIPQIERAILSSNLGLTPVTEGPILRVPIPPLTEEKRKEIAKIVRQRGEECKIALRNIRRSINDAFKELQKKGELSDDLVRRSQDETQKITDQATARADAILRQKEEEILQV